MELNCNEIPSDWEDYVTRLRQLRQEYAMCFSGWYNQNIIPLVGTPCGDEIEILYDEWARTLPTVASAAIALIESLVSGSFDYTTYTNYITLYNLMIEYSDTITFKINNNCEASVINNTSDVDTINITNGGVIEKCTGVYIKQINMGSEFIGTITVIAGANEEWAEFYTKF